MIVTDPDRTLLYGLRVHSELPLHQDRRLADAEPADVTIIMGAEIPVSEHPPDGSLLLDLELARRMYCATRHDDGHYTFRCHRVCDFVISPDLATVTVRMMRGGSPELAAVLASGTLLSFILAMQGHAVLHASAVQVNDVVVAFVGMSGMGKSTMAGLMCSSGARLVTDDVLRVDLDDDGPPSCHLGATELRLRKGAEGLFARLAAEPASRRTQDDRQAVRMVDAQPGRLPLAGIVIPRPHHDGSHTRLSVERLQPLQALLTLIRFPRILGWQDPAVLGRQFDELGAITERVPVFVANMPWGPPFADELPAELLDAMGLGAAAAEAD